MRKQFNYYNIGIMSRGEFIEKCIEFGYVTETKEVDAIKDVSNKRYFRMDLDEQRDFERKQEEADTKTEYRFAPNSNEYLL